MRITALELHDFRSYGSWTLEPDPGLTILVGPNAAGKTNAVEAIRLLTTGGSFRRPRWEQLVRWGMPRARAALAAGEDGPTTDIVLDVREDGTRSFTVNGKQVRSPSAIAGIVPSVVFTPDDLGLVKGSAERRRAEVDELGEQLSATYGRLRREYDRVVRQRNKLLKSEAPDPVQLEAWNAGLVELGSRLRMHRAGLVDKIAAHASAFHSRVCGDTLSVRYMKGRRDAGTPVAAGTDPAAEAADLTHELCERRAEEVVRGVTLVGPHRDDIEFAIDGRPARAFASQGQQRTVVLAWKIAELHVVRDVARTSAVLLLDDVMSELDAERRRALTAEVGASAQTFITTTNTGYFDPGLLEKALVVRIGGEGSTGG
jgi:DNA replication and repair protein RecF